MTRHGFWVLLLLAAGVLRAQLLPCGDFEGGDCTDHWSVEGGTWEIGVPTSGPGAAYSGDGCAGTVLAGSYADNVSTRLLGPWIQLPAEEDAPCLRFWHWFSTPGSGDYGRVQIRVDAGAWIDVSENFYFECGDWTRVKLDLSDYSGMTVQVAFYFHSDVGYGRGAGWYIDDVMVESGDASFSGLEDWESGLGQWGVTRGYWQVGLPASGPGGAHSGGSCAATVLGGSYGDYTSTRLFSPWFVLPSSEELPRLRFWHWFSTPGSGDYGRVQIRSSGGDWVDLPDRYYFDCGGWTRTLIDLGDFAGQQVQIAFQFVSDNGYGRGSGWYVDDVEIESGDIAFSWNESWEDGLSNWGVSRGYWQVGQPTVGPMGAFGGQNCAATVLEGNYGDYASSMLFSPWFQLPNSDELPRLRFWHWFETPGTGDYGSVLVRTADETWVEISDRCYFSGGGWTRPFVDLTPFGGQVVQLAFRLVSDVGYGTGTGWFVDDVVIESGPVVFTGVENWEGGLGHWGVTRGYWQVGTPVGGPEGAFDGESCAGTVIGGYYLDNLNTRLTSPWFQLPPPEDGPLLRFWHWFSTPNTGDHGVVELRSTDGTWQPVSDWYYNASGPWSRPEIDLTDFGGQRVQLSFTFSSDIGYGVGYGWYIDDIEVDVVPVNEPWIRLLPGAVDFGPVELGDTAVASLTLSNIGSAPLSIASVELDGPFQLTAAPPAVLQPQEEVALEATFTPLQEGDMSGELRVFSDAVNRDTLRVALNGFGGVIPRAPTGLRIATDAAGTMHLDWDPVTETVFGTPLAPDAYLLFNATEGDAPFADYVFLVAVPGTSYDHQLAGQFATRMFYRVLAFSGSVGGLEGLAPGTPAADVLARLGVAAQ